MKYVHLLGFFVWLTVSVIWAYKFRGLNQGGELAEAQNAMFLSMIFFVIAVNRLNMGLKS